MTPPPVADARPFLKWAGGKSALIPQLLPYIPQRIAAYFEPFLGGGALFFRLSQLGRFRRAVLSDVNRELVDCYLAVRDQVDAVIAALDRLPVGERHYYAIRALAPNELIPTERAARFIYLNRVGFNGLYRVNAAGRFNVPFGRHRQLPFFSEVRLRRAAALLQGAEILCADFGHVSERVNPGDFVYCDPPYLPVSATANFTSYTRTGFSAGDHHRLASVLRDLASRGVLTLTSNSDTPTTRHLYSPIPLNVINARRSISAAGAARKRVTELLITPSIVQHTTVDGANHMATSSSQS